MLGITKVISSVLVLNFFTASSIFLLYLDDVMRAYEKIRELFILVWYFSRRMETISMKKKGNKIR